MQQRWPQQVQIASIIAAEIASKIAGKIASAAISIKMRLHAILQIASACDYLNCGYTQNIKLRAFHKVYG